MEVSARRSWLRPCYDARFVRIYPTGIAAILETASNPGNTLGAALLLNTTSVRWVFFCTKVKKIKISVFGCVGFGWMGSG